ncbi:surfeit locus protein 5 subunit 22 of mediator complex-domain-containing protein [Tricharina praecox]|uniref:surfeit locus protein 5 subunit 22 of mediator complex-domain-containing protein n=1 Tax=Tricharina praecox TaxID=43433 RepID=UPI00221F6DC4|nr:surfeit locus protein 5 subunit 22 of mediator complex-domain-containing protein [Tricharina praecox]KAI5848221.1 surfeit locus protein 5 subunit 22 of mediator complex-domain-containing protein [Tricharina praecox]
MSYDPNAGYRALQGRVNADTETLLKRFENIAMLAPVENKDKTIAAAEAYQIETHASSMIRAAEDLVALTRQLKEAWLFGQLGGGFEGGTTGADADAVVVGEMLRRRGTERVDSEVVKEKEGGREVVMEG